MPRLRLRFLTGPRRGEHAVFSGPRVRIGRSRDNDFILADSDEPQSSGHHAEIIRERGRWWIRDLESTNGTFVNGIRVSHAALRWGYAIALGGDHLVVEDTGQPVLLAIIAPFRAFLHNVTASDQLACRRRVRDHLRPGGHFAFNVFHPSLEYMAQHAGALAGVWRWAGTYMRADGGSIVRSEANRYDTVRHCVYSQHRYEEFGPDGALRRTFLHQLALAYLYPADIRRILSEAGFTSVQIDGGFDGRPFEKDTDELVIEAGLD